MTGNESLNDCPVCKGDVMEFVHDSDESIIECQSCGRVWPIAEIWNIAAQPSGNSYQIEAVNALFTKYSATPNKQLLAYLSHHLDGTGLDAAFIANGILMLLEQHPTPDRCKHEVWLGDRCEDCVKEASNSSLAEALDRIQGYLEHYQQMDDGLVRLMHGLKATPESRDPNSPARSALADLAVVRNHFAESKAE